MPITASTRVVGIFGDPVAHTLSPVMHNAALQKAGIDAVYVPFHVTPALLPEAVRALRALQMPGINLTIPHKEAVCSLLDELDPLAERIGAVNTIVNRDGRLSGHNTDGLGLLQAIGGDLGIAVQGRRVLVVGAGGAARAAVVALAGAGASWIGIANRTRERAEKLRAELAPRLEGTALAALPLSTELPACLEEGVDLLVNSSAAGLKGEHLELPLARCVHPGGAVYDMIYARKATPLVASARAAGLLAADGLGMLVGQGEAAFRLWFSSSAPAGVMRRALEQLFSEN
jgi:shikimate dehydrogenase